MSIAQRLRTTVTTLTMATTMVLSAALVQSVAHAGEAAAAAEANDAVASELNGGSGGAGGTAAGPETAAGTPEVTPEGTPELAASAADDPAAADPFPPGDVLGEWLKELPVSPTDEPAPIITGPVPLPPPPGTVGEERRDWDSSITLWDRIRRGFGMPDLAGPRAAAATRWYAGQPEYLDRMSARASLYLFHIVEEIEKRGMPTELALLPFVESAMQPEAESHAKAAGLWQFIPSTGKIYALEQNLWKDERRDVIHSTRAALDYLEKLYNDFGDWHLALAAYNMGEYGLARAIERNRKAKQKTDYASLRIPVETQGYVPKLQAIKNIVRDPAQYGLELANIPNEPYFVVVPKTRDIDVATAAKLADMPIEQFRALNPSFNRPVILGALQPNILLPAEKAELFAGNLAAYTATGQPLTFWTGYTMKPGETLAQVAQRVGVAEAQLREANRVPPRYRLAPGSTILIPRDETMEEDIPAELVAARFSLVPEHANLRQVTYRVRRGDTLRGVAARWRVQPEEVMAWNYLRSEHLFAGQRLILTVMAAPTRAPAARPAAKKNAAGSVAAPIKQSAVKQSAAATRPSSPTPRKPSTTPARATTQDAVKPTNVSSRAATPARGGSTGTKAAAARPLAQASVR